MNKNSSRAAEKSLAILEAKADQWAVRTELHNYVKQILEGDNSHHKVFEFCKLSYIEGIYDGVRGYGDDLRERGILPERDEGGYSDGDGGEV